MIRVQILAPLVASYSLVSSLYFTCKVEIIILPPRICRIQREDLNIKCQHTASDIALERELFLLLTLVLEIQEGVKACKEFIVLIGQGETAGDGCVSGLSFVDVGDYKDF